MTVASTLLILVDQYYTVFSWKPLDRFLFFLVIPMALVVFVFRESPARYGFVLGDWKAGLLLTLGAVGVMLPVLWWLTRGGGSMREYYRGLLGPSLPLYTFLDLFGWEFTFRGWLLFGYERKFGPEALWLQAVPFAVAHLGKPQVETLSTIFGGFAFGWVAWRTRSFLYPFLIHWAIFTFVVLFSGGIFG